MAANNPNNVNAKTVQGPDPTGNQGYPIAVVPATGSDPFPIGPLPSGFVIVTDIRDGAGDSIMEAAINAARVRAILPSVVASANQQLGSTRWIDDESGVRMSLQVISYVSNAFVIGTSLLSNPEGHGVIQLLASGARTTAQTTSLQQNVERKGCRVFLNVTAVPAVPGAGGLTVIVETRCPVSLVFQPILTAAVAVQVAGLFTYTVYPAALVAGDTQVAGTHIGTNYRVRVAVGDAQSYTYSLGLDRIK